MPVSVCETFRERDLAEEPPRMGSRRVSQTDTGSSAATDPATKRRTNTSRLQKIPQHIVPVLGQNRLRVKLHSLHR